MKWDLQNGYVSRIGLVLNRHPRLLRWAWALRTWPSDFATSRLSDDPSECPGRLRSGSESRLEAAPSWRYSRKKCTPWTFASRSSTGIGLSALRRSSAYWSGLAAFSVFPKQLQWELSMSLTSPLMKSNCSMSFPSETSRPGDMSNCLLLINSQHSVSSSLRNCNDWFGSMSVAFFSSTLTRSMILLLSLR